MSEFYQDDLILINDKHIEIILKLIYSKRANALINLPNEVVAFSLVIVLIVLLNVSLSKADIPAVFTL